MSAFAITWMLSAWRASPSGSWLGDYATIQGMSGVAIGGEGVASAVLFWVLRLVPLGTQVQRLSMVSAFGAAWAAWFAYQLSHKCLDRDPPNAWSRCWLALGASLVISLGTTAQCGATRPNGSLVAAAAGLASIVLIVHLVEVRTRVPMAPVAPMESGQALLVGSVAAVTWLESHLVGLLVILVGLTLFTIHRSRIPRSSRLWMLGGFGAPCLLVGLPWYFAPRGLPGASVEHAPFASLSTLRPFSDYGARLDQWITIVGPIWFGLAVVGLILMGLGRGRHQAVWVLVTLGVSFVLIPLERADSGDRGGAIALIGGVILASMAAHGLRDVIHWSTIRKPNAAALATTLAVVSQAVTVFARSEAATYATEHYQDLGAEAWTDEALADLPARAIVLARTQAIVERIHAAKLAEGLRPDVLVVPLERATDPRVVALLLAAEPNLTALLRDLAINGRPSENSMSGLADARPLFVEFDGNWDPRLREHLLVQPFLHRVLSQTLGRSDRTAVLPNGQRAVARLIGVLEGDATRHGAGYGPSSSDAFTRVIVDQRLREQLTLLLALGDRQSFDALASDYAAAFTGGNWLERVRQRMGATNRSAVDAFDLLNEHNATEPDKATTARARKRD